MLADLSASPAYCITPPPFSLAEGKKETAAQANGRRYEEKALPYLEQWAKGNGYIPRLKPWIVYRDLLGRVRYCQPDFLAIGETTDNLLIVEVKLRHTRDAFKQLRLYREMVSSLHPRHVVSLIELCRYFDPDEFKVELFPELRPHNLPFSAVIWEPSPTNSALIS